jgi:hypothetical protein
MSCQLSAVGCQRRLTATSAQQALALLALPLLAGCIVGDGKYARPRDLPDQWLVDRMRILGVKPEPPEARPGQPVSFSALLADPNGEADVVIWFACEEAGGAGCDVDLDALPENPTPEQLAEAGVIGAEPGFAPVYVPPADILDALPAEDRLEGLTVTVQLAAFPAETGGETGVDLYNQAEVGYKRLVVSEAATPNANPWFSSFTVDGFEAPPDAAVEVDAGEQYELGVTIPEEAVETYTYVTTDGVSEERVEEPYVTWYVTGGSLDEYWTLHPYTQATWRAPDSPGEVVIYAVVRDRRGGTAWHAQPLTIR